MKKIIISISLSLLFIFGCGEENKILEPVVTKDSVEFSFNSRENGKIMVIYRNNTSETVPITFAMAKQREVLTDSQNYDFCPDITNFRNGVVNSDWFIVNFNIPITPEKAVLNQDDHPNLVSYSLPMGTYVVFTMDSENCNNDLYDVFDITTNEALQVAGG